MGHDLGRKFVEKRQIQIHFESLSEDVFGWTAILDSKIPDFSILMSGLQRMALLPWQCA